MAAQTSTIGELFKAKVVTEEALSAATAAALADPTTGAHDLGAGISIDLAKAITAHAPAARALADENGTTAHRRTTVRDAIVLASASTKGG